jgi:hypothetical protein
VSKAPEELTYEWSEDKRRTRGPAAHSRFSPESKEAEPMPLDGVLEHQIEFHAPQLKVANLEVAVWVHRSGVAWMPSHHYRITGSNWTPGSVVTVIFEAWRHKVTDPASEAGPTARANPVNGSFVAFWADDGLIATGQVSAYSDDLTFGGTTVEGDFSPDAPNSP